MPGSMYLTPATKSAPMIGVLYRLGQPTGEVIRLQEGDQLDEWGHGELSTHLPEDGIPRWHEWTPGRSIECLGTYPREDGLLAVYGARWTGDGGNEERILEQMKQLTGFLTMEFRLLLMRTCDEAVERWGAQATEDVVRKMANRVIVEAFECRSSWPDAATALAIATDEEHWKILTPAARVAIRLAMFGNIEDDQWHRAKVLDLARSTFDAVFRGY